MTEHLLTARATREADARTIAAGTPGIVLMERAGEAVARAAAQDVGRARHLCWSSAGRATTAATASRRRGFWRSAGIRSRSRSWGAGSDLRGDAAAHGRPAGPARSIPAAQAKDRSGGSRRRCALRIGPRARSRRRGPRASSRGSTRRAGRSSPSTSPRGSTAIRARSAERPCERRGRSRSRPASRAISCSPGASIAGRSRSPISASPPRRSRPSPDRDLRQRARSLERGSAAARSRGPQIRSRPHPRRLRRSDEDRGGAARGPGGPAHRIRPRDRRVASRGARRQRRAAHGRHGPGLRRRGRACSHPRRSALQRARPRARPRRPRHDPDHGGRRRSRRGGRSCSTPTR